MASIFANIALVLFTYESTFDSEMLAQSETIDGLVGRFFGTA